MEYTKIRNCFLLALLCLSINASAQTDNAYQQDSVLIPTTNGAAIAALVVLKKNDTSAQTAALDFSIYTNTATLQRARIAADHGYAGVVAFSRGKGWGRGAIAPYEQEVEDVNAVIDWITHQPWSNGQVGMYGGSYDGFAQWAAAKHLHPALKTIVPYVAAIPGQGLPMENNIFLNANYGWAFYVTNNKYLDTTVYNDPQRWRTLQNNWYQSGVAYNKIDSIDGTPNKWLQRWLQHPAYDRYWQSMVPYQKEFAHIHIPVLTITGYYDDGQISALHYLKEHYQYSPQAQHYLIIGPYDHIGAQRGGTPVLRGYTVDTVALINTREITFAWFDHIFKKAPMPALIKDRINYQVMGSNQWQHAPSLEKMHNHVLKFYLNNHQLTNQPPRTKNYSTQQVDLADRTTSNNNYYPYPIITDSVAHSNGISFISEPLAEPMAINGQFTGALKVSINKKDMDIGVVLYEVMPDGRCFHLAYYLGRASYADNISKRKLLTPGAIETIRFERSRFTSKLIQKGSRLLVVLNVNKNPFAEINYGTGKNVSEETIQDAGELLQIKWYNDSYIQVPVWQ